MAKYNLIRDKNAYPYAKDYGHRETEEFKYNGALERILNLEINTDQLYDIIEEQQKRIDFLMETIGLLARAENIRIDRARAKQK